MRAVRGAAHTAQHVYVHPDLELSCTGAWGGPDGPRLWCCTSGSADAGGWMAAAIPPARMPWAGIITTWEDGVCSGPPCTDSWGLQ